MSKEKRTPQCPECNYDLTSINVDIPSYERGTIDLSGEFNAEETVWDEKDTRKDVVRCPNCDQQISDSIVKARKFLKTGNPLALCKYKGIDLLTKLNDEQRGFLIKNNIDLSAEEERSLCDLDEDKLDEILAMTREEDYCYSCGRFIGNNSDDKHWECDVCGRGMCGECNDNLIDAEVTDKWDDHLSEEDAKKANEEYGYPFLVCFECTGKIYEKYPVQDKEEEE